jgi:hypothetical protein
MIRKIIKEIREYNKLKISVAPKLREIIFK